MSLWSPAVYYLWTVTIRIYDVWTLHSRARADCSTHVPVCYQQSAIPYVAMSAGWASQFPDLAQRDAPGTSII